MKRKPKPRNRLAKRAARGFHGYPVATISYYGPDDQRASKAEVGVIPAQGAAVSRVRRWTCENGDVRDDPQAVQEILDFMHNEGAASVVVDDQIMGCPHEEGIDYPLGERCPRCPFWAGREAP